MRRASPIWVILLLLSSTIIVAIPSVPYAHAANPVMVQNPTRVSTASGSSLMDSFVSNVASGNTLLLGIGTSFTNRPVNTVTDTLGTVYTVVVSTSITQNTYIYSGKAPSSGADTVTVTISGGTAAITLKLFEVSGITPTASATGTKAATAGTCPCAVALDSALAFQSDAFLLSEILPNDATRVTAGSHFSLTGQSVGTGQESCADVSCVPSGLPAGTTTTFPITLNSGGGNDNSPYDYVAAVFNGSQVVTAVVACTFFQLQCWWYPMLFFGVYAGLFGLISYGGKVSSKGATYLMLTGLTFASMLEVIMGMLNIMFPIILTGLTVIYAMRAK